ncbi:MAG: helix-turn-helix domain-containing protein [Pseudomonadota bacterium]
MAQFPGILAKIAEVAGESAATRLALAAGGTTMTFSARPNSALAKIVGAVAAAQIAEELGPVKYAIPMAHLRGEKGRRAAAAQMLAQGATASQVAKSVDVHQRSIHRVKARMRRAHQEGLPLFPGEPQD